MRIDLEVLNSFDHITTSIIQSGDESVIVSVSRGMVEELCLPSQPYGEQRQRDR